jgi:hypothetical protein
MADPITGFLSFLLNVTVQGAKVIFQLGPSVTIKQNDIRCREEVGVSYPADSGAVYSTTSPTMFPSIPQPTRRTGRAIRLRLILQNDGYSDCTCHAFLTRVFSGTKVHQHASSPLQWSDEPEPGKWAAKTITRRGGNVVLDICHSDNIARRMHVTCLSSQYGRFVFAEPGIYTLEIHLKIDSPFKSKFIQMDVRFNPDRPLTLERIGSIRQSSSQPKGLLAG